MLGGSGSGGGTGSGSGSELLEEASDSEEEAGSELLFGIEEEELDSVKLLELEGALTLGVCTGTAYLGLCAALGYSYSGYSNSGYSNSCDEDEEEARLVVPVPTVL